MTLPAWPASVPSKPDVIAFKVAQAHPPLAVTQFEDGPDRRRRQSHTRIKKLAYAIVLDDDAQCATAVDFLDNTLDDASGDFTMDVAVPGQGYVNRRCYIEGGEYSLDPFGLSWRLTFTLCVYPSA